MRKPGGCNNYWSFEQGLWKCVSVEMCKGKRASIDIPSGIIEKLVLFYGNLP